MDGDLDLYFETAGVINRLAHMEEIMPDMIVVMIENTNRNRDMMPTNTSFFKSEPGAENFKIFINHRQRQCNQLKCLKQITCLFLITLHLLEVC